MIIKQISIFVENRKGRLADILKIIYDNNINIRAISVADTTNFGILRIIVEDPDKTKIILRENNITASITNVIAVNTKDQPGGLYEVLKLLAENDISIEYLYHMIVEPEKGRACIIMRVENELETRIDALFEANGY